MESGKQAVDLSSVRTTRLELMKTKRKISMATRGIKLLKAKRSSLVIAFLDIARKLALMRENMLSTVTLALETTKIAEIESGSIALERIAAERSRLEINVKASNVMGVRVSDITADKPSSARELYGVISSPAPIDDMKTVYSRLFNLLIEVAEKENAMRKLLREIEKVNRRINALEDFRIPLWMAQAEFINEKLGDTERDTIVSLKFIKRKLEAKGR